MDLKRTSNERLAVLEEKVSTLKTDVASIDTKVSDISSKIDDKFAKLEKSLEDKFSVNDTKYASKLTEKIVYGLVGFIVLTVIAALLSYVIVPFIVQSKHTADTTTSTSTTVVRTMPPSQSTTAQATTPPEGALVAVPLPQIKL